jgi:hypothetical protein
MAHSTCCSGFLDVVAWACAQHTFSLAAQMPPPSARRGLLTPTRTLLAGTCGLDFRDCVGPARALRHRCGGVEVCLSHSSGCTWCRGFLHLSTPQKSEYTNNCCGHHLGCGFHLLAHNQGIVDTSRVACMLGQRHGAASCLHLLGSACCMSSPIAGLSPVVCVLPEPCALCCPAASRDYTVKLWQVQDPGGGEYREEAVACQHSVLAHEVSSMQP